MSSYLFSIAMEYLSKCLSSLKGKPRFKFYPKYKKNEIIALLLSDDLLILSHGSKLSV